MVVIQKKKNLKGQTNTGLTAENKRKATKADRFHLHVDLTATVPRYLKYTYCDLIQILVFSSTPY